MGTIWKSATQNPNTTWAGFVLAADYVLKNWHPGIPVQEGAHVFISAIAMLLMGVFARDGKPATQAQ